MALKVVLMVNVNRAGTLVREQTRRCVKKASRNVSHVPTTNNVTMTSFVMVTNIVPAGNVFQEQVPVLRQLHFARRKRSPVPNVERMNIAVMDSFAQAKSNAQPETA